MVRDQALLHPMDHPEVELTDEGTCSLRVGALERWRVALDFGADAHGNPFREALVWHGSPYVIAGGGRRVHVLRAETGALEATIDLSPDAFGHLAMPAVTLEESTVELLLILGWTDVRALDTKLSLLWHAQDVAVDGITFDRVEGSVLRLHAEMDPPGGWFAVSLDAASGREQARQADFLPGYVGP